MKKVIEAIFIGVLSLASCQNNTAERVSTAIEKKILKFKQEQTAACRTNQLKTASQVVDSMLLAEALAFGIDSLTVINRLRPEKPEVIDSYDSLAVKPIFDD